MTPDHVFGCFRYGGTWLLGIGIGYVCARRDGRAEALAFAARWRELHMQQYLAATQYIAEWRHAYAVLRARGGEQAVTVRVEPDVDSETTMTPGSTYEDLVRQSGQ